MYGEVQLIQKKYTCGNWWYHFGDIAASTSFNHVSYATINTIYCGIGGLNKEKRSIQILKWYRKIAHPFWRLLLNSGIDKCSCNKAPAIKPIGKLFHYISNINYLLLVRFGINISICISSLEYTYPEEVVLL